MNKMRWITTVTVVLSICILAGICSIGILMMPDKQTGESIQLIPTRIPTATLQPVTPTSIPTSESTATSTSEPTATSTTIPDPNHVLPGIYLVGKDIQPGIYRGETGTTTWDSCYWARLQGLSGTLDDIIANDNAVGQYYVEVQNSDFALETACELIRLP